MRPGEYQAPGGTLPQDYSGELDQRRPRPPLFVIPLPFDYWSVQEITVPLNTPLWLDSPDRFLMNRRAWAVINTDPVAGNNVWIGPNPMSAIGQGGRVLAQGGSLSFPGGGTAHAHAFTNVAAGVIICFYQFS
jgi:hypothetical protein